MAKKDNTIYATGKRKTSIAKVWLTAGSGKITVNGMNIEDWLGGLESKKKRLMQPLVLLEMANNVDIKAFSFGGGITGQTDAVRHGISKALALFDTTKRGTLKSNGLLTRDSRIVERKKYGKKKARRSPQFSKR